MRMGAGVGGAVEIVQRLLETDLRDVLPKVTAPTLVLHRRGDRRPSTPATPPASPTTSPKPTWSSSPATTPSSGPATSIPIAEAIETCYRLDPRPPPTSHPASGSLTGSGRHESRVGATRSGRARVGSAGWARGLAGLSTDWWEALLPALAA